MPAAATAAGAAPTPDCDRNPLNKGDGGRIGISQGKTRGKTVRKLTAPREIKGHDVAATEDDPQYLVESQRSGERAAHKPEALTKKRKSKR